MHGLLLWAATVMWTEVSPDVPSAGRRHAIHSRPRRHRVAGVPPDRNAKENFTPVEPGKVLEQVAALPVQSWNYLAQVAGIRHLGPMAEDFHAAFGLGEDDKHIATVDADGVALAAIQGLNQKVDGELKAKDARIDALEKELAALKELVMKLSTIRN